ncbi:MAG: MOSC N-terminal beta barrel domain-containing protein [Betaproteobacteria bacterium]|nr:MOSC N-terminal beta barrel domain-containing protein [Betaproteobacteria bacterium]
MTVAISQLNIYPVKSLKGIAVDSAAVTDRGLAHDRRFMVVDPAGGFLTQRDYPRMATVWTEIAGDELRLAAPDAAEVAIPLEPVEGESMRVEVWDSACLAIAPSPEADRWLTDCLGRPCRLVYMPDSTHRLSNPRHAGNDKQVGFADGYAFLIVTEASLADLNARLAHPVPLDRFRANIVVRGALPFAEDGWGGFAAGTAVLRMAKPCGRCRVTTTDQSTGEVTGPEPLATLAGYRNSPDYGARFGMNAVTVRTGAVRLGDAVVPS